MKKITSLLFIFCLSLVTHSQTTITLYEEAVNENMDAFEGIGGSGSIDYVSFNNPNNSSVCIEMSGTGRYAFAGFRMKSSVPNLDLSDTNNLYFRFDVRVSHTGTMPDNANLQVALFNQQDTGGANGERVSVNLISNYYSAWNSSWTTVEVPLSALTDERPGNGVDFDWSSVNNFRIRHSWPASSGDAPADLTIGIDNVVISDQSVLSVTNFDNTANSFTINSPVKKGENIHITGKNINTIDIYNITGQLVSSKFTEGLNTAYVNSSLLSPGLYVAVVNKAQFKKFIVR